MHEAEELQNSENITQENSKGVDQAVRDTPKAEIVYKMEMDEVMEKLDVPWKKVVGMDSSYLLALNNKEEIEKIVVKLQTLTKVTWSVKQTRKFADSSKKRPEKPVTLFKRQYGCHMSTRTRAKTKKLRNKKSRNINCPAQLMVSIKSYASAEKAKGKIDYPCLFEFRKHHNHLVDVEDVLTTRPLSDQVKEAICHLLTKGHSCASAYHTLYTLKVEEFGPDYNVKMCDRHLFPRRNDISTIYKMNHFKEKYDRFLDLSHTVKNLDQILATYHKKNGTLYKMLIKNDTVVICICTPIMQRPVPQASNVLFIDTSSDDYKEYKMYFVLTQSDVGALPIGCILSNKHDISAFGEGMKLFLQMVEIEPELVLSNGEIVEELIANDIFPNSRILYSFYHTLKSTWKVLYDTRHELPRTMKDSFFQLFREVVFADNEEALVVARQVLSVECANQKFLQYVDKMYENIHLWCLFYRRYMDETSNSYNYDDAELSFRLFRLISRVPLERTKLFNVNQITDFVCSAFERYFKNRIVEMVSGRKSQVLEDRYGRLDGAEVPPMEHVGHHQYLFTKIMPEVVDMLTVSCTCGIGAVGKHCEHVADILEEERVFHPELTDEQKVTFYFVATGVLRRESDFSMENGANFENEDISLDDWEMGFESDRPKGDVTCSSLNTIKTKWMSYCRKMVDLMETDPARFLPAIDAHLTNIEKHSDSVASLLRGLYAGFPGRGAMNTLPPLTMITPKTKINKCESKQSRERTESQNIVEEVPATRRRFSVCSLHRRGKEGVLEMRNSDGKTFKMDGALSKRNFDSSDPKADSDMQRTVAGSSTSGVFELQKGIFMNEATLSRITQNDVTVLNDKKRILIIPLATD